MLKLILVSILILLCIFLLIAVLFGIFRTMQVQSKPQQREFLNGKVPKVLPNGFYKGTVTGLNTTWQGKKFDASRSAGINVFKNNKTTTEQFPFKTYVGKGVQDTDVNVLKIDYSDNKNPWWLEYILDEVVEVSPGKYLGKVHITFIPGIPFTMGYFRLEK